MGVPEPEIITPRCGKLGKLATRDTIWVKFTAAGLETPRASEEPSTEPLPPRPGRDALDHAVGWAAGRRARPWTRP